MNMTFSKFECSGCGEVFREEPPKCPKCGTFRIIKTTKIFTDIDTSLNACRTQLEATAELSTVRNHRKARFVVTQLRRAKEYVEVALRAVQISGPKKKTQACRDADALK